MTLQIDGLNKRQRMFADIMWAMDSPDDVSRFIKSLPSKDQCEARTVMNLMIWAMLDTHNDTTIASEYLSKYSL
jgi:hypothetical protein